MTIYRRHRHDKGFAAIDNRTLRDKRLSFRARGVLVYLLSQPARFAASSEAIAAQGSEGREAIRSALRELEAAGYLRRSKARGVGGRISTVVHVYERPEDWETDARKPVPGVTSGNGVKPQVAPGTGKPYAGKPGAKNLRRRTKDREERAVARDENPNPKGAAKARAMIEQLAGRSS